ncbi:MAG: GH25 family lysozyme [Pseudomonadota bacterium]
MRTRPLALLALILLAACGGRSAERSASAPTDPTQVVAANFGDADPTNWGSKSPTRYPVHGIDVSRYQTSIDWRTARANGVNFAFIKALEGVENVDPMFREHWNAAGRAGVPRGAYHFFYHCAPAAQQARAFIRTVPRSATALPPVLDMEWTPFSPTCTTRRDGATIRAEARIFLDIVGAHYGKRPVIYTSVDFFRDNDLGQIRGVDFWLRAVAKHPSDLYPGQTWTFWQYTSTGIVPGVPGKADINVFAGSRADWAEWVGR